MARGFISLAAVLDWFTRRVLSWSVSITLDADFCFERSPDASRQARNLQRGIGQPGHVC